MLKFDEEKILKSINGALAMRPKIEAVADELYDRSFDAIFYMGIGGTYATGIMVVDSVEGKSKLPIYVMQAARYIAHGNAHVTDKSLVVIASDSGTTAEMIEAVEKAKIAGALIVGFVEFVDSPLAKLSDRLISYPHNEQLKLFMFAHRLMYRNGEFKDYERFYKELDAHLADAFVDTSKRADAFALAFAEKHKDDPLHYYVSAGNHFGANYSYAMCYVEEQHWIRSKSIHASEFFHGTLEVIDRDTNVTVFVGEDEERPLAERVARFLPRICARYTIIDTKDYPLKGISPEFRGLISYLVCHAVTERIDAHIEKLNCHPMDIRRYYRRLDY